MKYTTINIIGLDDFFEASGSSKKKQTHLGRATEKLSLVLSSGGDNKHQGYLHKVC